MNKVPEQIQVKEPYVPRWERQSRQGWAMLIEDIGKLWKKAEKFTEPTNNRRFTYIDLWRVVVVTTAGSCCIVAGLKIMEWLWHLNL